MRLEYLLTAALLFMACGDGDGNLFSGSIEIDEVRVSSRVGGFVSVIAVEEGDEVEQGQLLAKIDDLPYSLILNQSQAGLSSARAGLETLLQGARHQQITSASSAVEAARAIMMQRETDLQRSIELSEAGAISEQNLQEAQTAAVQAETNYNSAVQAYSLAVEGARSTEIQAAEAGVESAQAVVDMNLQQLEWTTVNSPIEGTVTAILVLAGENVSAGMTLVTVAPTDTVRVIFYISETVLGSVHIGDRLTVTSDGGYSASGVLTRIADSAEFTPSSVETRDGRTSLVYRVEGIIPNDGRSFKAGMPVDVRLETL